MFQIGHHAITGRAVLAPMAGITDRPFRRLCKRYGAALAVSEMITSDVRLWDSSKTRTRLDRTHETGPFSVQIAGNSPVAMAEAARMNVAQGAEIIDINMGCPAKKVCKAAAGSALLRDEPLVGKILDAVVAAVDVPVTLKIRTGWSPEQRNGITIARMAQSAGVRALTVHGRTRACGFKGGVEYDTIAEIKQSIEIPVIANGDITTPEHAKQVLDYTQADAVMIGRGAQGKPWIFSQINDYLTSQSYQTSPDADVIHQLILEHLNELVDVYGEYRGLRIARKHVSWYLDALPKSAEFRTEFNKINTLDQQVTALELFFQNLASSTNPA